MQIIKTLRNYTVNLFKSTKIALVDKEFLFFKHENQRHLYILIPGTHCPDAKKFLELFEYAIHITQKEFDAIYDRDKLIEIVTVGDQGDVDAFLAA